MLFFILPPVGVGNGIASNHSESHAWQDLSWEHWYHALNSSCDIDRKTHDFVVYWEDIDGAMFCVTPEWYGKIRIQYSRGAIQLYSVKFHHDRQSTYWEHQGVLGHGVRGRICRLSGCYGIR